MTDDHARRDLHRAIEDLLDPPKARALMALLPPACCGDVATNGDLHRLEARLDAGMEARSARERGRTDVGLDALDTRVARIETRLAQLDGRIDRSTRAQTRTLGAMLAGTVAVMTLLWSGALWLAT